MSTRPKAVAFDIVETTISLEGLRPRFVQAGLPAYALEHWFAGLLRDAFALDTLGRFHPFPDIARATLAAKGLDRDAVEHVIDGFAELDAHPDAAPAMRALRDGGVAVCALTNGSDDVTRAMLDRNGLAAFVNEVVTIGEIKRWKPAREVYDHAAHRMGVANADMALVAAHPWDCAGAAAAGYATGFLSRDGAGYPKVMGVPDVTGDTLTELVSRLLDLPPA